MPWKATTKETGTFVVAFVNPYIEHRSPSDVIGRAF